MSDEETTAEEWKTIRIRATSYYKLAELSGIYTALFGAKVPMSLVTDWAIIGWYDNNYSKLKNILMNPGMIEEFRKEVGGKLKRLFEVISNPKYE